MFILGLVLRDLASIPLPKTGTPHVRSGCSKLPNKLALNTSNYGVPTTLGNLCPPLCQAFVKSFSVYYKPTLNVEVIQ